MQVGTISFQECEEGKVAELCSILNKYCSAHPDPFYRWWWKAVNAMPDNEALLRLGEAFRSDWIHRLPSVPPLPEHSQFLIDGKYTPDLFRTTILEPARQELNSQVI